MKSSKSLALGIIGLLGIILLSGCAQFPGQNCGTHRIGDSWRSDDGCNTCGCTEQGIACTEMYCYNGTAPLGSSCGTVTPGYQDACCASRNVDTGHPECVGGWKYHATGNLATECSWECGYSPPNGTLGCGSHQPGESWRSADGCNTCSCTQNGRTVCTLMACPETFWKSSPKGDFAYDDRDPQAVCGEIMESEGLSDCELLEYKSSDNATECAGGISIAGCFACRFSCASGTGVGMANPAAVYCSDFGYSYEIREYSDGSQYGVCIFPDSSECDEWSFYRGSCGSFWASNSTGGGQLGSSCGTVTPGYNDACCASRNAGTPHIMCVGGWKYSPTGNVTTECSWECQTSATCSIEGGYVGGAPPAPGVTPRQCCSGLVQVPAVVPDDSGACSQGVSEIFVCTNCGDGVCGVGENLCNCRADCTGSNSGSGGGQSGSPGSSAGTGVGMGIANPAATYCVDLGYAYSIDTAPDGSQSGFCTFPDGFTCDEWSFYRGECGEQWASSPSEPVFCTMEAMLCPDGATYVGRNSSLNCAFDACPEGK